MPLQWMFQSMRSFSFSTYIIVLFRPSSSQQSVPLSPTPNAKSASPIPNWPSPSSSRPTAIGAAVLISLSSSSSDTIITVPSSTPSALSSPVFGTAALFVHFNLSIWIQPYLFICTIPSDSNARESQQLTADSPLSSEEVQSPEDLSFVSISNPLPTSTTPLPSSKARGKRKATVPKESE